MVPVAASIRRSVSDGERALGSRRARRGSWIAAAGLSSRLPMRMRCRKNVRTADTRRASVDGASPSARIAASQRSRSSTAASADVPAADRGQGGEIAAVRVDRPRRALRCQMEQEALDLEIGGGSGHGARLDSLGKRPLLSRATLGRLAAPGRRPRRGGCNRSPRGRLPSACPGVAADRARHVDRAARRRPRREGADHVPRARQAPARAGVGCRERDLPQRGTPASQLRDRLLRWLGQVRAAGLEGLSQRVRAVPRAVAPVARDRVHRARRLALGAAALAQVAGELRPAAVEDAAMARGSCGSRTGAVLSLASRRGSTGATAGAGTTSSADSRIGGSRCTASRRRPVGSRSTASAAWCTSTPTTRRTGGVAA